MADPSFDVVSKVDRQEVDNALNQAAKELAQRFDFRGTNSVDDLGGRGGGHAPVRDRGAGCSPAIEVFKEKLVKRGISLKAFDVGEPDAVRQDLQGHRQDPAGHRHGQGQGDHQAIRDEKLKGVQAQIQGDQLRVTGKKKDDLQAVIALLKGSRLRHRAAVHELPVAPPHVVAPSHTLEHVRGHRSVCETEPGSVPGRHRHGCPAGAGRVASHAPTRISPVAGDGARPDGLGQDRRTPPSDRHDRRDVGDQRRPVRARAADQREEADEPGRRAEQAEHRQRRDPRPGRRGQRLGQERQHGQHRTGDREHTRHDGDRRDVAEPPPDQHGTDRVAGSGHERSGTTPGPEPSTPSRTTTPANPTASPASAPTDGRARLPAPARPAARTSARSRSAHRPGRTRRSARRAGSG